MVLGFTAPPLGPSRSAGGRLLRDDEGGGHPYTQTTGPTDLEVVGIHVLRRALVFMAKKLLTLRVHTTDTRHVIKLGRRREGPARQRHEEKEKVRVSGPQEKVGRVGVLLVEVGRVPGI
jgi:hypothetical protein